MNTVASSDYEIDDSLRFENLPRFFNLEIYIKDEKSKKIFPLAPHNYASLNKIVIKDIPTTEEWEEILRIHDTTNEFSYCKYVVRVIGSDWIKNRPEFMNLVLSGNGFSPGRFTEMQYIISLSGNRLKLFLEKNIPTKYLRLLEGHDPELVEKFTEYLLLKEINGNTVRELLNMWVDLDKAVQFEVHNKFLRLLDSLHKDRRARLGEEFKKILFELRYPFYYEKLSEIDNFIRDLSSKVKINIDPQLENESYNIQMKIESVRDIEYLRLFFTDENLQSKLEKLLNLLK